MAANTKYNELHGYLHYCFAVYSRVVNRDRVWILKNCRASIGSDAGAKSRFSVSDRVFAIADCINVVIRNWCDCGWLKLIFVCIKISSTYKVMVLISSLNRAQTG